MNKNGGEGLMSTLLFKHVNVVDVRNQQILSDVDVLIKNERIEKMERDIKSSAEQVVDGEGKYLSPGIIDMHVHSTWDGSAISEDMDEMYGPYQAFLRSVHNVENSLKKGVTTIREVGSPKDLSIETAFAVEKGWIKGSRVIPCGSAIQSIYGHVPSIGTIANTKDELYYIIAISDKTGKAESRMMMSYRNHLSLIFPEAIILEVNRKLILFFDTKEVGICLNVLEAFLEKYDLLAVCSNQFHKITDFAYILNQLLMVIGLEKSLHFNKSLIHYQDYIMYCAIKKIGREGHIQYFCMPELLEVFRYDHKYGTSFAYSKRIALELASVTAAAQKLGIHRNTMEYRLRKFNDLSGISNYTADIVERLLFTYKILDLYPEILEEKDIL